MNRWVRRLLALLMLLGLLACVARENRSIDTVRQGEKPSIIFEQLASKFEGRVVIEDEGKFILLEGSKCVQREDATAAATIIQWIELPGYVDRGTVILNGWDLRFLHHDREIRSMRADITHSKLVKNADSTFLVFEAQGKLDAQEGADAFEFCVFYSVFGYRSTQIDASIEANYEGIETAAVQDEKTGALGTLEYAGNKGILKGSDEMAVIPRGFDFQFTEAFECELRLLPCQWKDRVDYRLLQIGYNLSQAGTSPTLDGSPHWVVQTVFKADDTYTHRVMARATFVRGPAVKLRANFLALNPRSGKSQSCRRGMDGVVRTQTFHVTDLPYDYAIPILTGWDLSNECEQQKVLRAGIWLHDIRFDSKNRSLAYKMSSILRDQDGAPGFNSSQRVSILGLNLTHRMPKNRVPMNIMIREQE